MRDYILWTVGGKDRVLDKDPVIYFISSDAFGAYKYLTLIETGRFKQRIREGNSFYLKFLGKMYIINRIVSVYNQENT